MSEPAKPWRILVVDDEEGIHGITRMIFRGYEFEGRPIELISALSGSEARDKLEQHTDIALVLLDVVMETDNAGLMLVDHIRNELNNKDIRIILRTGHPGYAPETEVIVNYDINDYLSKAELSASRLLTSVVVALRSYRDISSIRHCPDTAAAKADCGLDQTSLAELGSKLTELSTPLAALMSRLQQFEFNPLAQDIVSELAARQQRLQIACQQLQPAHSAAILEAVELQQCLQQLVNIFLPAAREQGWVIDYSVSPALPDTIECDPNTLQTLLVSLIEWASAVTGQANLKLSLSGDSHHLQIDIESNRDKSHNSQWSELVLQNINRLLDSANGQLKTAENSLLGCELKLK